MTLSLILTINNRSIDVSRAVAESLKLPGNTPDELVVVLDRATAEAEDGAVAYAETSCEVNYVEIEGEPGWKGPAKAWNAGFRAAKGDLLYCISSEVVQDAKNVEKARKICQDSDVALFGACHNSTPTQLVVGAEPGLLVSSKMPRPLGFIVCMPAANVHTIGGFDEKFMDGFWYDDDDFFLRLWHTGLDFVFDDSLHGVHLEHDHKELDSPEGHAGMARNAAYMAAKHGVTHPWPNLIRTEVVSEGRRVWRHV